MKDQAHFLGKLNLQSIFQRLPGVFYLLFIPFVIFGPIYTPSMFSLYMMFLNVFFVLNAVRTFWGTYNAYYGAVEHSKTNWTSKYERETGFSITDARHDLPFDSVRHTIIIPQYKEDLETICDTLDVLSSHHMAISNYRVFLINEICLAMEEAEKDASVKAKELIARYQESFYDITYTLHPVGRPGEIRGKSSNVAWAAREMVRQCGGPRADEIFTVMDADTAFAQDYFESLSYYYSTTPAHERSLLYFCPTNVFDRNADQVPFIVRCGDISWSIGVMCNLYPNSPVKFPVSAYSLPMTLAAGVGFWDTDPLATGEDFHMYLKCLFSSYGKLKVHTIYSPASCCNVQGDTYLHCIRDRYTQAKRHMWGCIDFGYALRRTLYNTLAPGYDAPGNVVQQVPLVAIDISTFSSKLIPLFHRLLEAQMVMGQVFAAIILTTLLIPRGDNPLAFADSFWSFFSARGVHPYVELVLTIGDWARLLGAIPMVAGVIYYERYQRWVGVERWVHSLQEQMHPGSGMGVSVLGKRSNLMSRRTIWNLLDWTALPICGFLFLTLPQFHAQMLQLFTDSLDYVVAGKPTQQLSRSVSAVSDKTLGGRTDSGFYEFDDSGLKDGGRLSPSMWREASLSRSSTFTAV